LWETHKETFSNIGKTKLAANVATGGKKAFILQYLWEIAYYPNLWNHSKETRDYSRRCQWEKRVVNMYTTVYTIKTAHQTVA
jgi:hypothetical protein